MSIRAKFEKQGTFHKVSGDTAYGWAFVSTIKGQPYFDTGDGKHSDHIPQESIDEVAALFMDASRAGLDMHQGARVADVLFSYPMTDAIMKGVEVQSDKTGLLIGWRPYDKALLEKIASGERIGFSIGGMVDAWDIVDKDGNIVESVNLSKRALQPFAFGKQLMFAKQGADYEKMKLRVFRSWKLSEISLVDRPMQEPALVGVVKSKGSTTVPEPVRKVRTIARAFSKGALLTTMVQGHQHVVDCDDADADGDARTSYETATGEEWGHDHAWVRNADGTITIAANDGHSHTVEVPTLGDGAPAGSTYAMRAGDKKESAESLTRKIAPSSVLSMTEQEIAALQKAKDRSDKLAQLTDTQRAYAKSLVSDSDVEAFVSKSATDRDAVIKAAIEFTAQDGTVYFKHDDPRMIKSAKNADELAKSLVMETSLRKAAEFAKAASEDLGNYPEDDKVHVAMIQAIESIPDEATRKSARAALVAGNAAFAKATRSTGTNGSVDKRPGLDNELTKAESTLKTAVEAYAKAKNIADFAVAFAEATGSDPASRDAFDKVSVLRKQQVSN